MANQQIKVVEPTLAQLEQEYLEILAFERKKANGHDELVIVVDCSGSMDERVQDVIEGFNAYIEKKAAQSPNAIVTLYKFNHEVTLLIPPTPILLIPFLDEFETSGGTHLYESIMEVITQTAIRLKEDEEREPRSVTISIFSDGEDRSAEDDLDETRELIMEAQDTGWNIEFYLMASLSSRTALKLGINPKKISDASNVKEAFLQIGASK